MKRLAAYKWLIWKAQYTLQETLDTSKKYVALSQVRYE